MIAPFVFYDSDVGVGFGVALVDIDFREQRRREFAGAFLSYTTEGQQNYTFVWRRWIHHLELPEGGVLQEERSLLRAAGGYERSLTRRFFGIGPKTHESDETSYRDSVGFLELGIDLALPDPGDDLVLSLGASGEWHDLGNGHVEGEPNTGDVYPDLFGPADPAALGYLHAGLRWDTRDSQVNPYRGWWVAGNVDAALLQGDGDVGALWTLSGGRIFGVPGHLSRRRRPRRGAPSHRHAGDRSAQPAHVGRAALLRAAEPGRIALRARLHRRPLARPLELGPEHRAPLLAAPARLSDSIYRRDPGRALRRRPLLRGGRGGGRLRIAVQEPRALELRIRNPRHPRARGALPGRRRVLGRWGQRLGGLRAELLIAVVLISLLRAAARRMLGGFTPAEASP